MMTISRRRAPRSPIARVKLALASFLTAFLVLAGTSVSYAFWTTSDSVTSTLGAATLSLSTNNFSSVAYTFGNDSLATTGSVTVTNTTATTSTQSGAVTLTFGPASATTMASKVTLNVWSTTAAANCTAAATVPGGATTALWSASPSVSTTLAPGASAIYCLRSSVASRESVAVAGGTMSFSPRINGTITVGNFTGSSTATVTQATQYIYPAYTSQPTTTWNWIRPNPSWNPGQGNVCMDVYGGNTSGSQVISRTCNLPGTPNELWQFSTSSVAGYYTITPKNATGLRLDNQSTNYFDAIKVSTASSSLSQLWQLQLVSPGVYEIVSAYNGYCLNPAVTLVDYSQFPCNGGTPQQYYISAAFTGFTCAVNGNTVSWSWTGPLSSSYAVNVTNSGGTTTTALASTTSPASFSIAGYSAGTYTVTFVDSYGTNVASGTFTRGTPNSCTANALVP